MNVIGPRFHATLAWALLFLVTAAVYLLVMRPVEQAAAGMDDRVDNAYRKAARMRALSEALPQARKRQAQLDDALARFYTPLSGEEERQAVLSMRKLLEKLAAESGVQITNVDNLAARSGGGFERLGLVVGAQASVEAAAEMLRALEQERPFLLVDDLSVLVGRQARRRVARGQQDQAPEPQTVQMRFTLFRLNGGEPE